MIWRPIRWLNKTWGLQSIIYPISDNMAVRKKRGVLWTDGEIRGTNRSYVKIWRMVNGKAVVVDRALNQVNARKRIRWIKRDEQL